MTIIRKHWEAIYKTKDYHSVSWFQATPKISFDWITKYLDRGSPLIDIGSGTSFLVDNLINSLYKDITLLEISKPAIDITTKRLGKQATNIALLNHSVLDLDIKKKYNVWHDRAVFHFLTKPSEQDKYIKIMTRALKSDGYFIMAAFALNGPKKCSNLDIIQYDTDKITNLLDNNFTLIDFVSEEHQTPSSTTQNFNYFIFQKTSQE